MSNYTPLHEELDIVWVQQLFGTPIKINIKLQDATVFDLMEAIQGQQGIPLEQMRLIFGGKQLSCSTKLCTLGYKKGNVFQLILRMSAGMFHASSGSMIQRADLNFFKCHNLKLLMMLYKTDRSCLSLVTPEQFDASINPIFESSIKGPFTVVEFSKMCVRVKFVCESFLSKPLDFKSQENLLCSIISTLRPLLTNVFVE